MTRVLGSFIGTYLLPIASTLRRVISGLRKVVNGDAGFVPVMVDIRPAFTVCPCAGADSDTSGGDCQRVIAQRFRVLVPLVAVFLAFVVGAGLGAPKAVAAPNATPNYEVKLNLTGAALDSSGGLSAAVRSALGLGSSAKESSYEYFDNDDLDLNGEGWSVRLRHKEGKDLDLNYKKRFPVVGGDINAALTEANQAGFDATDTNYDAQIDWTYDKQTLSFANKKSSSAKKLSGTELPKTSKARDLLVEKLPGKLEDARSTGWGRETLKDSSKHGPVTGRTWSGTWHGVDVDVEVLPVRAASGSGTETIIEFSFKVDTFAQASTLRAAAIAELGAAGWLKTSGVLKTSLILQRY